MYSWQEVVEKCVIGNSTRVRKVTAPLREHFDITYFTYHSIDQSGHYQVLLDRPDMAEVYVEKKLYRLDPFLRHPDNYGSGQTLVRPYLNDEGRQAATDVYDRLLKADDLTLMISKSEERVEFFGFAAKRESSRFQNLLLNNRGLLFSFGTHFKSELADSLAKMREEPMNLSHLNSEGFGVPQKVYPEGCLEEKAAFLRDLGMGELVDQWQSLSPRERQCLAFVLQPLSARQCGEMLGLSPRTVEAYKEHVKNKLNCYTKQELYLMAKEFHSLGLL